MYLYTMNAKTSAITLGTVLCAAYFLYEVYWKRKRRLMCSYFSPVYVCNNVKDWEKNEKMFIERFYKTGVIGLDCEWVTASSRRNPVALLQLATVDGLCVLVRLCNIPAILLPVSLVDCLRDPTVLKVGVGVVEDAQKLLLDHYLEVRSCLDLRYVVQEHPSFRGKGPGLKILAEKLLNVKLKKSVSLTCSNWEAHSLSSEQVAYAAEDALASAQIFNHISKNERLRWWCIWQYFSVMSFVKKFEEFLDLPFKLRASPMSISSSQTKFLKYRSLKMTQNKKFLSRSKPMYENCHLQAPDGEMLCSCDRKKAMWYVHKGRGEIVNEHPFTVRLNFEPSDRPILDNAYYIQEKANCCVVCGETKFFFRKQVVPSEYRKYFPDLMKKSLSHDVLLLCVPCHRKSNIIDQSLREKLAKECDAPIGSDRDLKVKGNPELSKIKSAARALMLSSSKIPLKRKEELMNVIKEFYGVQEVSDEFLKKLSDLETHKVNSDYIPHGLKVYQYFCKQGGLIKFESLWRRHFLETMKPKFLPVMWSVDHNHERLAVKVLKKKVDFDVSILGLTEEMMEKAKLLIQTL